MSLIDYDALAVEMSEVLSEVGMVMQMRTPAPGGVYDPEGDVTTPSGPPIDTSFWGVTIGVDEKYSKTVGTENIHVRDQLVYMEATPVRPTLEATIYLNGERWQVVNVMPISPAGIPVLYILQVRP